MKMQVFRTRFSRKSLVLLVALFLCLSSAFIGYAINAAGKPTKESEVPGNWTLDHTNARKMMGWPLNEYSAAVHAKFMDDSLKSEFGDHPAFTASMRVGEDNPRATSVKILSASQMNTYLKGLPNSNLSIKYYGDYPKGLSMPVLVFTKPRLASPTGEAVRALGKPVFYLRAQVHGGETAASYGAIMMAQRLAQGHPDWSGVLDKMSIVIMPCMNLDGTKIQQRGTSLVSGDAWINKTDYVWPGEHGTLYYSYTTVGIDVAAGFDQNRDNMWLSAPVSRVNAQVLSEYKPEFVMDAHEYGCGDKAEAGGGGAYFAARTTSGDSFIYDTGVAADGTTRIKLTSTAAADVYWSETMTTQYGNHLGIPADVRAFSEKVQLAIAAGLTSANNPGGSYGWEPYVEGSYGYTADSSNPGLAVAGLVALSSLTASEQANMASWADANGNVPDIAAIKAPVEGGFDPGIGRNSMGFTPAVSFLAESRNPGGRWEIERRVMGQYLTNLYYVRAITANYDEAVKVVAEAREEIVALGAAANIAPSNLVSIKNSYRPSSYNDVVAYEAYLEDASIVTLPANRMNSRFGTTSSVSRQRPYAYIMDADYVAADEIAFRMSLNGIEIKRMTAEVKLDVESFTITQSSARSNANAGSPNGTTVSTTAAETKTFPVGSYIFYLEQERGNHLPLYFEPESNRSWFSKDIRVASSLVGKKTPFYRYMTPEKIENAESCVVVPVNFDNAVLQRIELFSIDALRALRSTLGQNATFAQTVVTYGYESGDLRMLLPDDATDYTWYVYNNTESAWRSLRASRDTGINRVVLTLTSDYIKAATDGEHEIVMARAGERASSGGSGGGGGGCDAGFSAASLLTACAFLAFLKRGRK